MNFNVSFGLDYAKFHQGNQTVFDDYEFTIRHINYLNLYPILFLYNYL